jgi:hypothetical protein
LPGAGLATARIARRFAPRTQSDVTPCDQQVDKYAPQIRSLTGFVVWPRTLSATLVLLALLPNLTVAGFVWLPAIRTYWSPPVAPAVNSAFPASALVAADAQPTQVTKIPPILTAPTTLEANASEDIGFPIALDGTDGVPARSSIAINGLPVGATLSNGRAYGETGWNLKSDEIGDLHLLLPNTASGETRLGIQLVAPDGEIIAHAETILRVTFDPEAALVPPPPNSEPKPELTETQANEAPLGKKDAEAKLDGPEAANAGHGDRGQSVSSGPAQAANDDATANWIQPATFVNLRERPSSSAPVTSVVAKGARLVVMGHKHRWVRVTNPATSESGWIYAGNVAGLAKSRHGPKRVRHPESPSGSDDSIWTSLGHWLASP